jgi:hypothetical protein
MAILGEKMRKGYAKILLVQNEKSPLRMGRMRMEMVMVTAMMMVIVIIYHHRCHCVIR